MFLKYYKYSTIKFKFFIIFKFKIYFYIKYNYKAMTFLLEEEGLKHVLPSIYTFYPVFIFYKPI